MFNLLGTALLLWSLARLTRWTGHQIGRMIRMAGVAASVGRAQWRSAQDRATVERYLREVV